MRSAARIWRHFDLWLLAAVVILTTAGLAMIRSAIAGNQELADSVSRQAIFAAAGLVIVLILAAIDYRIWSAMARPIYIFIVLLLAFIFVAGEVGFGAQRWFRIGLLNIQPSELAKVMMILFLADFFSRQKGHEHHLRTLIQSIALIGIPALLVLLQPDLSTAIVLVVIWLSMVWATGLPLRYLGILLLIGIIVLLIFAPLLYHYFTVQYALEEPFYLIKHYQMKRIVNFLFPDPEERYGATYNVQQALISIGSGGWLGQGYQQGTQVQLRFLKVRHTDFIFSVLAQEFGFAGTLAFLVILFLIIHRCIRAARMARDRFGALICYGFVTVFLFQSTFNIGMNLNLFPVSGIPLPFFSYGGSSLLVSLMGIGLVESVILRHKQIEL